jgi:outer membrane lipoprotein-sorting protein
MHPPQAGAAAPDPYEILEKMRAGYARVHDYKTTFIRQEQIKGRLSAEEFIDLEFKRPFMIRMRWQKGKNKGREVVYVEGSDEDKVLVRLNGLMGRFVRLLLLDPEGALAMRGSHRSIRQAGIGNLVDSVLKMTDSAKQSGDLTLRFLGEEVLGGRDVYLIERILPSAKYDSPRTLIYVDKAFELPVQIMRFDARGDLFERYTYGDLRINQDISAAAFVLRDKLEKKPQDEKRDIRQVSGILEEARRAYDSISDYTADFHKKERIGKDAVLEEIYSIRFMKPFYLGFKIIDGKFKDTEIFYRPLRDGTNKMLVQPGGAMGTILSAINMKSISVPIDLEYIKKYHRHVVSEFGIGYFLSRYEKDFKRASEEKDIFVSISHQSGTYYPEPGYEVELILKSIKKLSRYYAYRTLVLFSDRLKLPVVIKVFDQTGELLEHYEYRDLRTDVGLNETDFDPEHPDYRGF